MKNRTEKIGKFRFKMNFSLDSCACRDAGASHSLCLNELFQRTGSVLEVSRSVISGLSVSSDVLRATLSTAIKADDHAGRVFPRLVCHVPNGGIAEMNCFNSSGVTPAVMMFWSALIGSMDTQQSGSDDGYGDRNVLFALCGAVAKSDFAKEHGVSDSLLGAVVCRFNRRIFQEDKKLVFERYQPLADVVRLMAPQRLRLAQF